MTRPDDVDELFGLGNSLSKSGRHEEAIATFDRVLALQPTHASALYNRGNALARLDRPQEAIACYDRALASNPNHAGALYNRGRMLQLINQHAEAIASYDKALVRTPERAEIFNSRGNALQAVFRHAQAVESYNRALEVKPAYAEALYNRGNALQALTRHEEAIASYEAALELVPDYRFAAGAAAYSRAHLCDWAERSSSASRLIDGVRAGKLVSTPFPLLCVATDAADQQACSAAFAHHACPRRLDMPARARSAHDRLRVAYLSSDFHEHATAYLAAELFERHDRTRFEIFALSFGPKSTGPMRARLAKAFDQFVDISSMGDDEVARLISDAEIDIAVDLKGFTTGSRPGIFAHRSAPIQVNYLGFPGTMGADCIDYIIADEILIPPDHRPYFSEKVAYLPDTYQVNDSKRAIGVRALTRADAGLPEQGFVFCSFNNSYKITPSVFDVWMRLLQRIDGSVLWLLGDSAAVVRNLKNEAKTRSVSPERLVFAPRIPLPDHLARHRLADLFLDTLPCNAHTTASDALWVGLPVLTCLGQTFAGRVAASLLNAIDVPELITQSLLDYEAFAMRLATEPGLLPSLTKKLVENRTNTALFDTDRFRRHIEAAYVTMWGIHSRGEAPHSFHVAPIPA